MEKNLDYTVTLLETLKRKPIALLREVASNFPDLADVKSFSRDELADKLCGKFLSNLMQYLNCYFMLVPTDVMNAIYDMVEMGPKRLRTKGAEGRLAKTLGDLFFVDKREWKDGKNAGTATFALPEEFIEVFTANCDYVEDLRAVGDEIELYANSAAVLYGVVTMDEFVEIFNRYNPTVPCPFDKKELELILLGHRDEESEWFLHGNLICHNEFHVKNKADIDEIINDFLEQRNGKPRWFPKDGDEFTDYCDDSANLETPEARALEEWLRKHGLNDEEKRCEAMYEALYGIQFGERVPKVMEALLNAATGKGVDAATQEFANLYVNFANRMRLRANNGHTAEEMARILPRSRLPPTIKVNPRANVGRNDPCPCGSGKKFKNCCGMKQKKAARIDACAHERLSVYLPMRDKTGRFVRTRVVPLNDVQRHEVAARRIGLIVDGKIMSNASVKTIACIVGDYAGMMDDQLGDPPIKQLIARENEFYGDDRIALEMYKKYRYTWLEVLEVESGIGLKCRDLLLDKEVFLMECSLSRSPYAKDLTVCVGVGELPNGTYMALGVIHSAMFENPKQVLRIVLSTLKIQDTPPVALSFADQARFAAETIRRVNATGRLGQMEYGGISADLAEDD